MKYNRLVPHYQPGLDELFSILLLKARKVWGIDQDTPVEFMSDGDFQNPPMDEVPGSLYLGCGIGSWANEHYLADYGDTSCFKLVAQKLNVYRYTPDLIDEVTREDRHGAGGCKYHLAQAIKDLYDMGWSALEVYRWLKSAFFALSDKECAPNPFSLSSDACRDAIVKKYGTESGDHWYSVIKQAKLWSKKEFGKALAIIAKAGREDFRDVDTYLGKKIRVYAPPKVQDNARISVAAKVGGNCDVVLMQGQLDFDQVGILLQQKNGTELSFSLVLEELRKHELLARRELSDKNKNSLKGEGTIEDCPIWHGHQGSTGQKSCIAIYNRSKTRPLMPRTAMSFEYIVDLFVATIEQPPQKDQVVGISRFLQTLGI